MQCHPSAAFHIRDQMSGADRRQISSACSPSEASPISRYPCSCHAINDFKLIRIIASSSTIKTESGFNLLPPVPYAAVVMPNALPFPFPVLYQKTGHIVFPNEAGFVSVHCAAPYRDCRSVSPLHRLCSAFFVKLQLPSPALNGLTYCLFSPAAVQL